MSDYRIQVRLTLIVLVACVGSGPTAGQAQTVGWEALAAPRTHAIMRHALAPGTGDPTDFRLGDCSTQRNLDADGRAQARAIGARIRAAGVGVDRVLTSQWCRATETARLLDVGPVVETPALNSFFAERNEGPAQTARLRTLLAEVPDGETLVLVTHQVNVTALTGVYPASGEAVLFGVGAAGEIEVEGRVRTDAP